MAQPANENYTAPLGSQAVQMDTSLEPIPNLRPLTHPQTPYASQHDFDAPVWTHTFENLLGDNRNIMVTGQQEHLVQLNYSANTGGLVRSPNSSPNALFDTVQCIVEAGFIHAPTGFATTSEVQAMSNSLEFSVQTQTFPQIVSGHTELDYALAFLNITSMRNNKPDLWRIGLLTAIEGQDGLSTSMLTHHLDEITTYTLWAYRRCTFNGDGSTNEVWYAVFPRAALAALPHRQFELVSHDAESQVHTQQLVSLAQPVSQNSQLNHATAYQARVSLPKSTQQGQSYAIQHNVPAVGQTPVASQTFTAPRRYCRKAAPRLPKRNGVEVVNAQQPPINGVKASLKPHHISAAAFDARMVHRELTDDEIFSGEVHPDDICGTLVEDLAKRYSNTTIAKKVNELCVKVGNNAVAPNTISKRITLSIKHKEGLNVQEAAGTIKEYQDARRALSAARGAANIRFHNGYTDQNKTGVPQGPRTNISKNVTDDSASDRDIGDFLDAEEHALEDIAP